MSEMTYSSAGKNRRDWEYVPKLLKSSTHVFIRDTVKSQSLQPPYRGPYKIVTKNDKYYTILIKNILQTISIDRQKPAVLEDNYLKVTPPPVLVHQKCPNNKNNRCIKRHVLLC